MYALCFYQLANCQPPGVAAEEKAHWEVRLQPSTFYPLDAFNCVSDTL